MNKYIQYIIAILLLSISTIAQSRDTEVRINSRADSLSYSAGLTLPSAIHDECGAPNLHLKTNVLGLGLGIANFAAEIDLAKHWSLALPAYFSAWDYIKTTIKFRTLTVQPEIRYWASKKNDGFFVGVHFGLSYYNIAVDGDYRYQDHNRETPAMGGGLGLGYRVPISKDKHWRLEFSLGAGVYPLYYDRFYNTTRTENGLMIDSIQTTYWGIDQASVSISYMFDLNKKGGKR